MDYNFLANEQHVQVIAFFLPEAPSEMLKIFDEVLFTFAIVETAGELSVNVIILCTNQLGVCLCLHT